MKPRVYIETSVISYLTAWPNRDVIVHGHQQATREWWVNCRDQFELYASELVVRETSAGDPRAARDRMEILAEILLLPMTEAATELAEVLVQSGVLPARAAADALHIAIAATGGVEYLTTWNCRHIANATIRFPIEAACHSAGYQPPLICTPEELLGSD